MKIKKMNKEQAREYRAMKNGETALMMFFMIPTIAMGILIRNWPDVLVKILEWILKTALYIKELGL